jgi:hypothetical protein
MTGTASLQIRDVASSNNTHHAAFRQHPDNSLFQIYLSKASRRIILIYQLNGMDSHRKSNLRI